MQKIFANKKLLISIIILIVLAIGIFFVLKPKNSKLAEITQENWGSYSMQDDDTWIETHYILYRDGSLSAYDVYAKSGKKNKKNVKITDQNVKEIDELLKKNINVPSDRSAVDGAGWKFTYFNEKNEKIGEYIGYIYDNPDFTKITNIIEEKTSK